MPLFLDHISGIEVTFSEKFDGHDIKDVIFNPPATIVFWEDGTKTVVKCNEADTYNKRTGLLLCVVKKHFGNTGKFNDVLNRYCPEDVDTYAVNDCLFKEEVHERLEDTIHKLSDDSLMATYHMLNQWEMPEFLGDIFGLALCVRERFSMMPKEISNRTISPIMEMVKNEIVRRQHDLYWAGLDDDMKSLDKNKEETWESYNREH